MNTVFSAPIEQKTEIQRPAWKWQGAQPLSFLIVVLVGLGIWLIPPPSGVEAPAWHLFAIFVATVLGLILKPLPMV